jgi:hypothetical protein
MFGVLIRSRGMPVGCDSIEPTTNPIRRLFTAISTSPRAATVVEISFTICCAGVTIRRSNQLNYAPALNLNPLPTTLAKSRSEKDRRGAEQIHRASAGVPGIMIPNYRTSGYEISA